MEKMAMEDQDDQRCAPTPRKPRRDEATPDVFVAPAAILVQCDTRRTDLNPVAPTSQDYGSESDDDEEMQLDLSNAPVRLADNGYELIITRDTAPRSAYRPASSYYRQRHRPEDNRRRCSPSRRRTPSAVATRVGTGGDKLAKYDPTVGSTACRRCRALVRGRRRRHGGTRSRMIMGAAGTRSSTSTGRTLRPSCPRLVRISLGCNAAWNAVCSLCYPFAETTAE